MHILVLPSFYPTDETDTSGLFFRDQALALQHHGHQVGIGFVQGRSLRRGMSLAALRDNRFQITETTEDDLTTLRMRGWNPIAQWALGGHVLGVLHNALVRHYISRYGRPDVLHAHCVEWAGYGASLLAGKLGIPCVITEHSSSFPEHLVTPAKAWLFKRALAKATAVVTVSSSLAVSLQPYLGGRTALVIPNLVDTQFFTPPATPPPPEPFVFVCVARLAAVKGIDLLLRAFAQCFHGERTVQLTIVGDGPERGALTTLCTELGLTEQVTFRGTLTPSQVREVLGNAHAFVLSSHVETFAVVLIEALAMGIPVIATRCGGPEDIITPDTGILVEPADIDGLAAALVQVRHGHADYDRRQLRTSAVQRFGAAAVAARLTALYQEIIHDEKPSVSTEQQVILR